MSAPIPFEVEVSTSSWDIARTEKLLVVRASDYAALEAQIAALPANWLEDSSLKTWFPFTAEELASLKVKVAALEAQVALLADPHAVHVNILRGILPLTKAQAIHIAGLPADTEEQVRLLRKVLTGAFHALRSYQYGNSATDLAEEAANAIDAALAATEEKE